MAVDAARQGQGVGRLMLRHITAEMYEAGAELMFATARESALGFYLRCGLRAKESVIVEQTGFAVRYVVLTRDAMASTLGSG
jgi:GNAT superfamily N-acetyltransferase